MNNDEIKWWDIENPDRKLLAWQSEENPDVKIFISVPKNSKIDYDFFNIIDFCKDHFQMARVEFVSGLEGVTKDNILDMKLNITNSAPYIQTKEKIEIWLDDGIVFLEGLFCKSLNGIWFKAQNENFTVNHIKTFNNNENLFILSATNDGIKSLLNTEAINVDSDPISLNLRFGIKTKPQNVNNKKVVEVVYQLDLVSWKEDSKLFYLK